MTTCKYVRKVDEGFEYGTIALTDSLKDEKRTYHKVGVQTEYLKALAANDMAFEGQPSVNRYFPPKNLAYDR